jgi:hypothetical protein
MEKHYNPLVTLSTSSPMTKNTKNIVKLLLVISVVNDCPEEIGENFHAEI